MKDSQALSPPIRSLATLVEWLGAGVDRFDEAFARDVARELHAHADRVELPVVEALGLVDVAATFSMDRRLSLVVTGRLSDVPGEITVRWAEEDFPRVPVRLLAAPRDAPYTFCTLDFSVRGRAATLLAPAPPLPAGLAVHVLALATIGDREEVRVEAHGVRATAARVDIAFDSD